MNAWRPMLRRARRLALRSPVRTLLTGLLVFLPVLVGLLVTGAMWADNEDADSPEAFFGAADTRYDLSVANGVGVVSAADEVISALPPGSGHTLVEIMSGFRTDPPVPEGSLLTVQQGAWEDPLAAGLVELVTGRLPGAGEVVVSPTVAEALGVDIGSTVTLSAPRGELSVVGLGTTRQESAGLLVAAGEFVDGPVSGAATWGTVPQVDRGFLLVDVPDGAVAPAVAVDVAGGSAMPTEGPVDPMNEPEGSTGSGQVLVQPIPRSGWTPTTGWFGYGGTVRPPLDIFLLVAVSTFLFVGVVAGAAFGIGVNRRRRAAGLLVANGAGPALLRVATASEAVVIAVPAALTAVVASVLGPRLWTALALPGWSRVWHTRVAPGWAALTVVAAVGAAACGAVLFARRTNGTAAGALLDGRSAPSGRTRSSGVGLGTLASVTSAVVVLAIVSFVWSRTVELFTTGSSATFGAVVVMGLWIVAATLVVMVARRLLDRGVAGRLVSRDLRRRPLGAGAAAVVVAVWVFASVAGAAVEAGDSLREDSATQAAAIEVTSTGVPSHGLVVEPFAAGVLHQRGSEADPVAAGLPTGLAEDLAAAGQPTAPGVIGTYTGPCDVCPEGFEPSILVLDSVDGAGLADSTVAQLEAGAAVTAFSVGDGQVVGGVPVQAGTVDLPVSAVVLRSVVEAGPAGSALGVGLAGQRSVLVGDTEDLGAAQAAEVMDVLAEAGVGWSSQDPDMEVAHAAGPGRSSRFDITTGSGLALWFTLLLVVTLGATAAHRREHGEMARVMGVLGAAPAAFRRLSSLTATSVAAVGVGTGISAAILAVVLATSDSTDTTAADVIASRDVVVVALVSLAVPVAVAALAWLLPPARTDRSPGSLGPA